MNNQKTLTTTRWTTAAAAAAMCAGVFGCDNPVEYQPDFGQPDAVNDTFVPSVPDSTDSDEVQEASFGVTRSSRQEKAFAQSAVAFEIDGPALDDMVARADGTELATFVLNGRLFVMLPIGVDAPTIEFEDTSTGDTVEFTPTLDVLPPIEDGGALLASRNQEVTTLLSGTEENIGLLAAGDGSQLLAGINTVLSGVEESRGLLAGTDVDVAAYQSEVLATHLLANGDTDSEGAAPAAFEPLTCPELFTEVPELADALTYEAGLVAATATAVADIVSIDIQRVVAGLAWSYWVDDMVTYLGYVEAYGAQCGTSSYNVSVPAVGTTLGQGDFYPNTGRVVTVSATRSFPDDAVNDTRAIIGPVIGAVMGLASGILEDPEDAGNIAADAQLLEGESADVDLSADSVAIAFIPDVASDYVESDFTVSVTDGDLRGELIVTISPVDQDYDESVVDGELEVTDVAANVTLPIDVSIVGVPD